VIRHFDIEQNSDILETVPISISRIWCD